MSSIRDRVVSWGRSLDARGTTLELLAEWSPAIGIAVVLWLLRLEASSIKPYLDQFFFFFAVTWLIGQWQRVRRERNRRHVAAEAQTAAEEAEKRLKGIAEHIEGYATGGHSILALSADLQGAGKNVYLQASKAGKFPVFDLDLQGIRVSGTNVTPPHFSKTIPSIHDGLPIVLADIQLKADAAAVYYGNLSTRNKNYIFHIAIASTPSQGGSPQEFFVGFRYRETQAVDWIYDVPKNFPGYDEHRRGDIFSF